jgi:signal transduction histidine kinase
MSNKEQAPVIIKFIFGVLGIGIVGYTISFYNYDESPVAFLSLVTFNHLDMILIRKSKDLYFRNEVRSHLFFLPAVWVLAAPYNFILSIGIFSAILKEGQQLNSASFNKQFNGFFIAVYTAFLGISMLGNLFNEHPIEVPAFGEIFILVVGILMMYLLIQNIVDLSRSLRQREVEIKLLTREKSWHSDLFSLVSHNLRTPLTAVYNSFMIEELKKSEFSKTAQFATVKMELDKILSIVD